MARFLNWSSKYLSVTAMTVLTGCGSGVELIQEGMGQGVVQYRYQSFQNPLLVPLRAEALAEIDRMCYGAYRIVREGKTRVRERIVEGVGGSEIVTEQWWGIRFQCTSTGEPP